MCGVGWPACQSSEEPGASGGTQGHPAVGWRGRRGALQASLLCLLGLHRHACEADPLGTGAYLARDLVLNNRVQGQYGGFGLLARSLPVSLLSSGFTIPPRTILFFFPHLF